MPAYQADLAKFAALDTQVVGVSMDSPFCHIAWQEKEIGKLEYPLLSDFYPHGAVSQMYGVFREGPPLPGICNRVVYIIDKQGKVAWVKQYELGEQPPNEEALAELRKLKS